MASSDMRWLGSAVDIESEELPAEYEQLMSRVRRIRQEWLSAPEGTMVLLTDCYERLQRCRVQDADGNVWTVSAHTLRWKVRPAGKKKWLDRHPMAGI